MTTVMTIALAVFLVPAAFGQDAATTVNWLTFEEAVERSKTEKRKIFIDVYTDWCGWCKVMDKNTFVIGAYLKLSASNMARCVLSRHQRFTTI